MEYCDKYDGGKESFEKYYNPVKERYYDVLKINPKIISDSAQKTIQEIFDRVDDYGDIPSDFCKVMRKNIEPIIRRLGISPEEIIDTITSNKTEPHAIITKKIMAILIAVIAAASGGIIVGYAYYSDPVVEYSLQPPQLPADLHGTRIIIHDVHSTNDINEITNYDCNNDSIVHGFDYVFDCTTENALGNIETVTTAISLKRPNTLLGINATNCITQQYTLLSDNITREFPYLLNLPDTSHTRLLNLKNNHIKLMDDHYEARDYVSAKKHATIVLRYFNINDVQALSTMGNIMRDENRNNADGVRCAMSIHSNSLLTETDWGRISLAEDYHVLKEYDRTIYWTSKVIEEYGPDNPDMHEISYMNALIIKANALYRMALDSQTGFDDARSHYEMANEVKETYDAWFGLGNIDRHEEKFDGSLAKYCKARALAINTDEIDEVIARVPGNCQ